VKSAIECNNREFALPSVAGEGTHGLANAWSDLTFDLVLPLSVYAALEADGWTRQKESCFTKSW